MGGLEARQVASKSQTHRDITDRKLGNEDNGGAACAAPPLS